MAPLPFRIGFSKDVHRLEAGEGFRLCGVDVLAKVEIRAHSDGDVALHAIAEAIFLALGEGDLGDRFPTESSATKGMDSSLILREALKEASSFGYSVGQVSVKIFLETPKLYAYKEAMREKLADLLGIERGEVGLALGTYEKLGPGGRGGAIEAVASALLVREEEG